MGRLGGWNDSGFICLAMLEVLERTYLCVCVLECMSTCGFCREGKEGVERRERVSQTPPPKSSLPPIFQYFLAPFHCKGFDDCSHADMNTRYKIGPHGSSR